MFTGSASLCKEEVMQRWVLVVLPLLEEKLSLQSHPSVCCYKRCLSQSCAVKCLLWRPFWTCVCNETADLSRIAGAPEA